MLVEHYRTSTHPLLVSVDQFIGLNSQRSYQAQFTELHLPQKLEVGESNLWVCHKRLARCIATPIVKPCTFSGDSQLCRSNRYPPYKPRRSQNLLRNDSFACSRNC